MDPDTLSQRSEEMIRRRVRGGSNEAESRALLVELLRTRGAGTLSHALHHDGFATVRAAEAFAEAFFATGPADAPVAAGSKTSSADPWWIVLEREATPQRAAATELPALVLGPLDEASAMEDLDSDSGTTYTLSNLDARSEGYVVTEAYALSSNESPQGERTPMCEQEEDLAVPAATADITVDHSPEGTLVHGTSRGDQDAAQALKSNGFRWSRNLEAWYLPRNLTHETRDRKVAALQAALGERVAVEIPEGGGPLTAAEKETAKQERAADRGQRMSAKAEKLDAKAKAHRRVADWISESIPRGQPILVGHHSEARARGDVDRIRTNMDKSIEYAGGAEAAQAAADRAKRTATGAELVLTITNRIERNEALVRKVDRELGEHETAQGIIGKLGADHPKVQAVGPDRLGVRAPERLAQLEQLKAEALDAIGHDRTKLEAAGGVTYGKHNVEPGDIIASRAGYTPVIRANAKTATVPTGYSWTDTISWSRVNKVVKAEKFTPAQVREILDAVDPGDTHRAAAFQKTLARAEAAASATKAASADQRVVEPTARRDAAGLTGGPPADTLAAREALERARLAHDGTYTARYAEWRALAGRDGEANLAPYRAMSPRDQEQVQREGLMAVSRIVDLWLDLRRQVAQAPEAAGEQQTRSAPAAWSREDDSLTEVIDVDAAARQRLSARDGTTQPAAARPPSTSPGR